MGTRRPTRDVDVLARNIRGGEGSPLSVVKEVAAIYVEDGLSFDASSARTTMIREQEVYPGTRIVIPATIGAIAVAFGYQRWGPRPPQADNVPHRAF